MHSPIHRPGNRVMRVLSTGILVLSVLALASPQPITWTFAQESCAEPNGTYQQACSLAAGAEVVGFLSEPGDEDAYRLETLDNNVGAFFQITGTPGACVELDDWNGTPIGNSTPSASGASLDMTLAVPGSFYVFVKSCDGSSSTTVPYRLSTRLTYPYPDAMKPQVRFSTDFPDTLDGWAKQINAALSDTDADYFWVGGRFMIRVNKKGITQEWPRVASPKFGPDIDDFIMTVDSRVCDLDNAAGYAGYRIGFRLQDSFHQYSVVVNVEGRRAWLNKVNGDDMKATVALTEPTRSTFIDNKGGVNRTTIRAIGSNIRVSVNGGEIINVNDSTFTHGRFNFVPAAWSDARPLATFDNVLITTPAGTPTDPPKLPGDPRERQPDPSQAPAPCTVS
ncbi:MAG: hypothetical protein U0893_22060 [Chloroflexota bacterium]